MATRITGILGGMGIDVTADLITRVIDLTDAATEQDHLPLIVFHNPTIPDRTQAIVAGGQNPLPAMRASADRLIKAGVDFIALPCNTAHYFYDALQKTTAVPIVHMLNAVGDKCQVVKPNLKAVGLLATTGTVSTGLYQKVFVDRSVKVLCPDDADQNIVMTGVTDIKARRDLSPIRQRMTTVAEKLITRGAEIIIDGCTDISLVVKTGDVSVPVVDSLQVLAEKIVELASIET